jgi:hypothetical protein
MSPPLKSDDEKREPSRQRTEDLLRKLTEAQSEARMLKTRIAEAEKKERAALRSPARRVKRPG